MDSVNLITCHILDDDTDADYTYQLLHKLQDHVNDSAVLLTALEVKSHGRSKPVLTTADVSELSKEADQDGKGVGLIDYETSNEKVVESYDDVLKEICVAHQPHNLVMIYFDDRRYSVQCDAVILMRTHQLPTIRECLLISCNKRALPVGGRRVQRPLSDGNAVWRGAILPCNNDLDAPANKKQLEPFHAITWPRSRHTEEQYSYSYLNRNMSSDRLSALMPTGGYRVQQKPPLITSSCSESSQVEKDGGKPVRNEKLEDRNETFRQWEGAVDYQLMAEARFVYTGQEQFIIKFDGGHQVTDDDVDITMVGCHGIRYCLPGADNSFNGLPVGEQSPLVDVAPLVLHCHPDIASGILPFPSPFPDESGAVHNSVLDVIHDDQGQIYPPNYDAPTKPVQSTQSHNRLAVVVATAKPVLTRLHESVVL